MKRSVSRASKMSTEAQENAECSLPGIPEKKWQELLEKEETDLFLLGIREEIITNCLEMCHQKYLEKQSVAFTVHCAYLAWMKVIGMYYMFRDPGDTDDPEVRKTWEPDEEQEPSIIDSWGSQCIKVESHEPTVDDEKKSESAKSPSSVTATESEFSLTSVSKMSSLVSEFFYGEWDDYQYPASFSESSYPPVISRKSSIFSRTLSMPRELLPMMTPVLLCKKKEKEKEKKPGRKH